MSAKWLSFLGQLLLRLLELYLRSRRDRLWRKADAMETRVMAVRARLRRRRKEVSESGIGTEEP